MASQDKKLENVEAGLLNPEESPTPEWLKGFDFEQFMDLPNGELEILLNSEESGILDWPKGLEFSNISSESQKIPIQDCVGQQGTTDVPLHQLETNQNQLNEEAESSRKPSRIGRKPTLNDIEGKEEAESSCKTSRRGRKRKYNEIERKERKRKCDIKYRKKKKDMWEDMIKDQEMLSEKVKKLKSERERSRSEKEEMEGLLRSKNEELEGLRETVNMLQKSVQGQGAGFEKIVEKVLQPDNAIVSAALALTEFLGKLKEEDKEGHASFREFRESVEKQVEKQEQRTVGNYQIPLSLVSTAEEITRVYGDVCATSTMNPNMTGHVYILFCATIKEMSDLPLEQIDKKTILQWREAIKYALCFKFQVEFAMKHLKEIIAPRYFLMKEYKEAENIEASLNALMELQKCRDIAKQFDGKPFSEGLWSYSVHGER